jgi:hypothetical protein
MEASMDFGQLAQQLDHPAVGDILASGFHVFQPGLDPQAAGALLAAVRAQRRFDQSLFLTEAEFDADPQYVGVNPRPGRNLLERFDDRLGFVEAAPQVTSALSAVLGDGYQVMDRKLVCGVPAKSVPDWLMARISGNPVNNLGAYVRPEYRDVTYFMGIDFHQDLIDHKGREADFITLYVYLHPVAAADAPLFLLEDSHKLGATVFPHALSKDVGGWSYGDGRGREIPVRQVMLTGDAGYAAMWHACTLHGTQPDAADEERVSLRYLIAKAPGARAGIDQINAMLAGPTSLADTRIDLAGDGSARLKQNAVNAA